MRILHINNEKTWRGGERQTLLTAREQSRQGFDVHIGCRPGYPLSEAAREAGLPILPLSGSTPAALLGLVRTIGGFDLLHCHTGRGHSLAVLASIGRRKPMVVSRRVDFAPKPTAFNRWKFSRVQQVVCVSNCIARLLEQWGVPKTKLSVIYEAVTAETYLPKAEARQELWRRAAIPPDRRLVGNIAAMVEHKDQATLLRAARQVLNRRREVSFVFVGDGPLRPALLKLRGELQLDQAVVFTGFIPQAQALLPALDVFAMSSCMEGLGTIVLDAALAGVPVATTAAGGLPEAVLHQQTGLVVPVGDASALAEAIMVLLDDTSLAARLAAAAQARIRQDFSVPAMAARYLDLYRRLV